MSRKGSFYQLDHSGDTEIGNEVFCLPLWSNLGVLTSVITGMAIKMISGLFVHTAPLFVMWCKMLRKQYSQVNRKLLGRLSRDPFELAFQH